MKGWNWPMAALALIPAMTGSVWAEGGQSQLGDFLLGTMEGRLLLTLLLTVLFMALYVFWRRNQNKK